MSGTTSNAQLARQIEELQKIIVSRLNEAAPSTDGWRHDMEMKLTEIGVQLEQLTHLVNQGLSTEGRTATCPFRPDITRAQNNHERLTHLEECVQQLRVDIAKQSVASGAAGGGMVSLLAGAMLAVGKALGWW